MLKLLTLINLISMIKFGQLCTWVGSLEMFATVFVEIDYFV